MSIVGLEKLIKKRKIEISENYLKEFEASIAKLYEEKKIKGPIHLSHGNEKQLSEIFQYINIDDWVFSAWRNHYHALLHGLCPEFLIKEILEGRSMGILSNNPKFVSSSIVGGIIPLALGVALGLSRRNNNQHVWCFIGDMTYETGLFWESYKYSQNFDLPLTFVVENNEKSVTSPTLKTWGKKMKPLPNIIYYDFNSKYPHHGTGNWVNF